MCPSSPEFEVGRVNGSAGGAPLSRPTRGGMLTDAFLEREDRLAPYSTLVRQNITKNPRNRRMGPFSGGSRTLRARFPQRVRPKHCPFDAIDRRAAIQQQEVFRYIGLIFALDGPLAEIAKPRCSSKSPPWVYQTDSTARLNLISKLRYETRSRIWHGASRPRSRSPAV
jgi:hypothetical protein